MASGVTYQANKRISFLPQRTDNDNGFIIGGQDYDDVWFIGGTGQNLNLINCHLTPSGGGGGVTSENIITSGSTGTAVLNQFVGFKSASGLAKTLTIPTATGSLNLIVVSDLQGDAYTNNITIVPVSGTIVGGRNSVYTNYDTVTLLDTSQGWVMQ